MKLVMNTENTGTWIIFVLKANEALRHFGLARKSLL